MDALPVTELTELPYASTQTATDETGATTGVSHACGHDVHVTCLLGAAELLADQRQHWSGTFVALFQPAEETAAGARGMLEDGLAQRIPRPDVAFAQHVLGLDAGTIGTQVGPVMSAGDSIRITVFGKGSHGSMPHLSVDPVVLAASIVLRLQTIVARETETGRVRGRHGRQQRGRDEEQHHSGPGRAAAQRADLRRRRTSPRAGRHRTHRPRGVRRRRVPATAHLRVLRPVPPHHQRRRGG